MIGDFLVDHPDISLIAFTGSLEVGLRIIERAAKVHPGQTNVKKVICEMGGKNAIIIDDDADLDEAVPQVLDSAFGFQGQKCSACSRVIVLDAIHDRFVERLVKAARSWRVGPAEDPAFAMGAVVDAAAYKKILEYVSRRQTGRYGALREPDPAGRGVLGAADDHRRHPARAPPRPGGDLRTGAGGHAGQGFRPGHRLGQLHRASP